jgi:hypothetical protein
MRIFPIMLPQTFYKIPYRPLTASPNIQLSRTKALGKARTKSASESSVLTLRQPAGSELLYGEIRSCSYSAATKLFFAEEFASDAGPFMLVSQTAMENSDDTETVCDRT